jgi:hypothetical protein
MRWRCAFGNKPTTTGILDSPPDASALADLFTNCVEDAMRNLTTICVAAFMLFALPAAAQKPGQTATQFYSEYRTAWVHSKSMDTLLPYISKESRAQYDATPREQRQPMFKMMKELGTMTNVKVVKETKTPDGYVLELKATVRKRSPRPALRRS